LDGYVGEIRPFALNFAPRNWALCNGAVLPVRQYPALFSLLGTAFGGDGTKDFWLPDLRGRAIVGSTIWGRTKAPVPYPIGATAGLEYVTLTEAETPVHSHEVGATAALASAGSPKGGYCATPKQYKTFPVLPLFTKDLTQKGALKAGSTSTAGVGSPHPNMQPFAVVNFCICLAGIYPGRNDD